VNTQDPHCLYLDGLNCLSLRSGVAGTPSSSRSEERQLREHLEYEEPEEPADVIHEVTEANVSIPNLPVPKSSDGDVRHSTLGK
jgi:hypothetical protein